jgi:hypothetical protein
MFTRCLKLILGAAILIRPLIFAQTPSSLAQPRTPDDPLELITGEAQPVQDAGQRAAAVNLIKRARALLNARARPPYDLKTTFTVSGLSSFDGAWSMEDISPSKGLYRWTAQGPSYSLVTVFTGGIRYSSQPATAVPLRLMQVRAALFSKHSADSHPSARTASATLNGAELSCVLIGQTKPGRQTAGARLWDEQEYCSDAHSGVLTIWSPAPGVYVHCDYSNALNFHAMVLPGQFTITEAGRTIVEARVESVTGPGSPDPALFDPATLSPTGVGSLLEHAWRLRMSVPFSVVSTNGALQSVVVHGMLTPGGELTETAVVASSSPSLNEQAPAIAASVRHWRAEDDEAQPGATPQQHEVFFTLFAVPAT